MEFKARDRYKNNEVVKQYDQLRFFSLKGRLTDWLEKRAIKRAVIKAGLQPGAIILDIPCGTGRVSCLLAGNNYHIVSSDISVSMVNSSRTKIQRYNFKNKFDYTVSDAANLPFLDTTINVIVSLRLFGHVPPPIRADMVADFSRVSAGYLVVAYYHRNCLQSILRKKKRRDAKIPWYPVTFSEISNELKEAGLEILKCYPIFLGLSETIVVLAKKRPN
jgi:ubiquinone/menaquinone biosynthesis C-methylase UbiE